MSQTGLAFVKDPFDQERYQSLRQISAELMALYTELSALELEKYLNSNLDMPHLK